MAKTPKFVKNFWIEGEVEGRKTKIRMGPKSANGGFSLVIKQRSNGGIKEVITLKGELSLCGKNLGLTMTFPAQGINTQTYWTAR